MKSGDAVATAQMRALIEHLGNHHGRRRGWQRRVAEQIGLSESTVSRIAKSGRGVGDGAVDRVVLTTGIDRSYFTTPCATPELPARAWPRDALDAELVAVDAELAAMRAIVALNTDSRRRVLAWARDRWREAQG